MLFSHLDDAKDKLETKTKPWQKAMLQSIKKAWNKLSEYYTKSLDAIGSVYALGTILNPIFKLDFFKEDSWRTQ